ncbi:hypothetical protein TRAPUB_705 [Trametes pubescens]|uniref:DUF6535 domain-containing protein n=1 Tax=Trametes pubescens TaxID=154538 RepID=A0A1M2VLD6_TRAPU|nr:hypothetical protein TRAPUB_705 [Trametes pubescens]
MSGLHESNPLSAGGPTQLPAENETGPSLRPAPTGVNGGTTDMLDKRENVYTQGQKTKAWSDAAGLVQNYSDDMIARWNKEIDTYLVFAGLFSAILTAFNVQSYLLLQPSAPDPSISILQQISSQLESFSVNPPFINATQPSSTGRTSPNNPPPAPRWAVWLNALWFSGLILSLASASIGIMVKHWLNEFSSGVSGTSRPIARVRQYRLNNLQRWRLEDVVVAIPILLQISLSLFLAWLLVLLWNLNDTVAAIASTLCAYLTPQIRALDSLWQPKRFVFWLSTSIASGRRDITGFINATSHTLLTFRLRLSHYISLEYWTSLLRSTWTDIVGRLRTIASPPESWRDRKRTWLGRERSEIDARKLDLDVQTLIDAYSTTLHPAALSTTNVCLTELRARDVIDYFRQLHHSAREHFGPAADSDDGPLGRGNQQQLLWLQVILSVLVEGGSPLSDDEATVLGVYYEYGTWPTEMQADASAWAASTLNALQGYLEGEGTREVTFIDQHRLHWKREALIENAMRDKEPLTDILLPAVTWDCRQVRLKQDRLAQAPLDDTKAAYTNYLESVCQFLQCADHALISPLPSDNLEIVHVHTRDVLAELTRALLDVFATDRVRDIRSTIYAPALWGTMRTLALIVSDDVLRCTPDALRVDMLRLIDRLAEPHDYDESSWGMDIPGFARELKARIIRIKSVPDLE